MSILVMTEAMTAVTSDYGEIDVQTSALNGAAGQSQLIQELMAMARANAAQADSSAAASSTQSADGAQTLSSWAPPAPGSTPADMFSGQTLGALTSAQEGSGGWRQQMDAGLANQMIGQLDSDGDGSLSLSEIENALGTTSTTNGGNSTSSTDAQDGLSAAFAAVDANGDGQLSSDELTNALGQMQTQHAHGHGHHHHGGAPPDALASDSASTTGIDGTSADDPSIATPSAASSTSAASASSSTSGVANADIVQAMQAFVTQIQQQAANLEAMLQSSGSTGVTA